MSSYSNMMRVDGLQIGVHAPRKTLNQSRRLAPAAPVHVFDTEDYKNLPASWPRAIGPKEVSCFVGVTGDNEMWFDFNALSRHTHYAAVVVMVQRVNAVTGQKADHVYLEKYVGTCPKHNIGFESDRFCPECGFKWPAQNYITNAAPGTSTHFWLDGWRSQDGEIRQFVFTDTDEGLGVAQQLIGKERTADIRFAIFLSKNPKPVSPSLDVLRRGGNPDFYPGKGIGSYLANSNLQNGVLSARIEANASTQSRASNPTIGIPVQQEVSFGRAVEQQIHADPNDIDFWQSEPAAVIMLTPAPADWVATVTRNGPTVDRTLGGMGPLAGLKGVG